MAESSAAAQQGFQPSAVVETRVVSPQGARVKETVFVLSSQASARLVIKGEVPRRRRKVG